MPEKPEEEYRQLPYKPRHLQGLFDAITADEFSDEDQYQQIDFPHLPPVMVNLVKAFLPADGEGARVVEIGPGATPFRYGHDNHDMADLLIEPSGPRIESLKKLVGDSATVLQGVAENLSIADGRFDVLMMFNGFFQVRSDYEAILEFNRVLTVGGLMIVNVHTDDAADIVVGRIYGPKNLVRMVCQFGFACRCLWEGPVGEDRYGVPDMQAMLVFEKVRDAKYTDLNMPQLVPVRGPDSQVESNLYKGRNIDLSGRERALA